MPVETPFFLLFLGTNRTGLVGMNNKTQPFIITECICSHTHKHLPKQLVFSFNSSLIIQPPLIRSRYYVRAKRVSHVVAGANERRLYPQAIIFQGTLFDEYFCLFCLKRFWNIVILKLTPGVDD